MKAYTINLTSRNHGTIYTLQIAPNDSPEYRKIVGEKFLDVIENSFPVSTDLNMNVTWKNL